MRELEFRAWYKGDKTKIRFHQELIDCELWFICWEDENIKYPFETMFIDDNWILEQYTGMKDKHGDKIFEGDIVKKVSKKGVTWFEKGDIVQVRIDPYGIIPCGKWQCNDLHEKGKYWEIVGNIHQNKELLK